MSVDYRTLIFRYIHHRFKTHKNDESIELLVNSLSNYDPIPNPAYPGRVVAWLEECGFEPTIPASPPVTPDPDEKSIFLLDLQDKYRQYISEATISPTQASKTKLELADQVIDFFMGFT